MNNFQANICLFAVTLCWSCEVVLLSVVPEGVNPFATTCVTSLIASILLGGCFFRRIIAAFKRDKEVLLHRILLLSVLNASYNILIEIGLDYLEVSTGAFTLSMTAVVLPVLLFIAHRGTNLRTWLSAGCVLAGILVAIVPVYEMPHTPGLIVMLVSCILRAIFIVKLNDYAREHEPVTLAAGMSIGNMFLAFIPWFLMDPTTFAGLPWSNELIAMYVIYGYFVVALATVFNIFAQRRASAAHSTIIYSTEIVYSVIWVTCLPNTILENPVEISLPIIMGCALIVLGNMIKIAPIGPDNESSDDESINEEAQRESKFQPRRMPDLVTALLGRLPGKFLRCLALFVVLLVVYLIIGMPFRAMTIIPGFTEFRPVCMLQPVYGIFFGIPGCLAYATGNLIGDILSDSLRWSSIAGFIGNFVYPFLLYLFWTQLRKKPFNVRTRGRYAGLIISIVICSIIEALIITPAVAYFYPEVDTTLFAISVLGNGIAFPVLLTIPFIILIQEELAFQPVERKRLIPGLLDG